MQNSTAVLYFTVLNVEYFYWTGDGLFMLLDTRGNTLLAKMMSSQKHAVYEMITRWLQK